MIGIGDDSTRTVAAGWSTGGVMIDSRGDGNLSGREIVEERGPDCVRPPSAGRRRDDEWDDFQWSYQRVVERRFVESLDAEDRRQRLERCREWMEGYLKWGRETLGFGVYLFQRPVVG